MAAAAPLLLLLLLLLPLPSRRARAPPGDANSELVDEARSLDGRREVEAESGVWCSSESESLGVWWPFERVVTKNVSG